MRQSIRSLPLMLICFPHRAGADQMSPRVEAERERCAGDPLQLLSLRMHHSQLP